MLPRDSSSRLSTPTNRALSRPGSLQRLQMGSLSRLQTLSPLKVPSTQTSTEDLNQRIGDLRTEMAETRQMVARVEQLLQQSADASGSSIGGGGGGGSGSGGGGGGSGTPRGRVGTARVMLGRMASASRQQSAQPVALPAPAEQQPEVTRPRSADEGKGGENKAGGI